MGSVQQVPVLLARPWQFANLLREFEVLIDGEPVARLRNGHGVAIPVACGKHEVVAKIDWCRSRPVTIVLREDSEACLRVRCSVLWWAPLVPFLIFVYIFVPGWHLEVEPA